jgi:hypothetical protein
LFGCPGFISRCHCWLKKTGNGYKRNVRTDDTKGKKRITNEPPIKERKKRGGITIHESRVISKALGRGKEPTTRKKQEGENKFIERGKGDMQIATCARLKAHPKLWMLLFFVIRGMGTSSCSSMRGKPPNRNPAWLLASSSLSMSFPMVMYSCAARPEG